MAGIEFHDIPFDAANKVLMKPHSAHQLRTAIKDAESEKDTSPPRTPRHKVFTRAFPNMDQKVNPDDLDLAIEGQGRVKVTERVTRSAGRAPPRARSAKRMQMIIRQQEMLRKGPGISQRTAPSIPSAFNQFGGRSSKGGNAYSAELEAHARKDRSPRHYMEKGE